MNRAADFPKAGYGIGMLKQPFDPARCAFEVWPNERGPQPHQCQRKPGRGYRGLFCRQHGDLIPAPGQVVVVRERPPTKFERAIAEQERHARIRREHAALRSMVERFLRGDTAPETMVKAKSLLERVKKP